MEITENYGMIMAGKGRIPCLRKLIGYKEGGSFTSYKVCINSYGDICYNSSNDGDRVLVRPSTMRRMEGKWDDYSFYVFKKDKLWWCIIHHEGELFKMRFYDMMYESNDRQRRELFDSVKNKETTAYDAMVLVSL